MVDISIPGFGELEIEHLVTDFTGTLSLDGRLLPGVKEMLARLGGELKLHVVTSDTFGTAKGELEGVPCELSILAGPDHDVQKETYVRKLGSERVVAVGNGRNDVRMLRLARLGIAVSQGEGVASEAVAESDIFAGSAAEALGLLLNPKRLIATLRY